MSYRASKGERKTSIHIVNDRFVVGGVSTILNILRYRLIDYGVKHRLWVNEKANSILGHRSLSQIGFGLSGFNKALTILSCLFPATLLVSIVWDKLRGYKTIIHLNTPYFPTSVSAAIAAFATRTPLIYTVHANRSHIGDAYWRFETIIARCCDVLVLELKASFNDYKDFNRNKRIVPIPFGVQKSSISHPWKIRSSSNIFTFVAINRLDKNRMTDIFIRAYAKQHGNGKSALLIVGDGPEKLLLEKTAEKFGVAASVTFMPTVPEKDIQLILGSCHCLLTLSAFGEVGMAGKIAAGMGIPILTYEFDNGSGAVYESRSEDELASKMANIRKLDLASLEDYGGRVKDLLFSDSDLMVDKYVEIYKSV
jgi:glycosyltransferase involved in cell wall biosynthesis